MTSPEFPSQPTPEQVQPLTITLSAETQEGIFFLLTHGLHTNTSNEVNRRINPDFITELDGVRETYTQLARNLHKEIDPFSALYMGLTDLLPPRQLEAWANQPVQD